MGPRITELFVYPLKSGQGISMDRVELDRFGPALDRRWMLVDAQGQFLTQRTHPRMAHLEVAILGEGLRVSAPGHGAVELGRAVGDEEEMEIKVWDSATIAPVLGGESRRWFSDFMEEEVRVLFLPDDRQRTTSTEYTAGHPISFADGYPILTISRASLEELNRRLAEPVTMTRFRPNMVVEGCGPHEEDRWRRVRIAGVPMDGIKPCPRCALIRVDPITGERGAEPLDTLAAYRRRDGHIWFGQNLLHRSPGTLSVGDVLEIEEVGPPPVGPVGVVAETIPGGKE